MGTTRVNFRLPEELIERADVAAEVSHKNRTGIVVEALREYLEEIEDDEAFREAVVELYLDDPFILSLNPTCAAESRRNDQGHHSYKLVGKLPYDHEEDAAWDEIKGDVAEALLDRVRDFAQIGRAHV